GRRGNPDRALGWGHRRRRRHTDSAAWNRPGPETPGSTGRARAGRSDGDRRSRHDDGRAPVGAAGPRAMALARSSRSRAGDERLVAVVFDRLKDAGAAARAVVASDLIPNALEILDAEAARALGLQSAEGPGRYTLVVGFDGVREQVEWQCSELGRIAAQFGGHAAGALPAEAWPRLASASRDAFDAPAAVMRLVVLPAAVSEAIEQGTNAARQ